MARSGLAPGATTAQDAVRLLDLFHDADVETWVGGGWGIDALLGVQSRDHRDLDVLIPHHRTIAAYEVLRTSGFALTTDWFPVRFEMIDEAAVIVDVHPIRLLGGGGAELEQLDGAPWIYDAEALEGTGVIAGRTVRCLSAPEQVRCHLGYEPSSVDLADMERLSAAFPIDLPAPYR